METGDKPRQVLLEPDEFEQLIKGIHSKCEEWLLGHETSTRLLDEFNRVKKKEWDIRGFTGMPDDYDWSAVPEEVMKRVKSLYSQFDNAWCLMNVAEKAVDAMQEARIESAISRAYYFGMYTQELNYTLDMQ